MSGGGESEAIGRKILTALTKQSETAISAAMKRAGMQGGPSRLYVAATTMLRGRNPFSAHAGFTAAVSEDVVLLRALVSDDTIKRLALDYLRKVAQDMKSGGDASGGQFTTEAHSVRAPDKSGEGGHCAGENHTACVASPVARGVGQGRADTHHVSAHSRALRLAARAGVALTVLDSFKVRDGRPIGDVNSDEIERLIGENAREAAVLRKIKAHFGALPVGMKLRDMLKPEDLQRFIQAAAEEQDGH